MPPNEKELNCYLFDQLTIFKPSVHILSIHTAGSGLPIECSGIRRRKADGIFYCIDVFWSEAKAVILQLS